MPVELTREVAIKVFKTMVTIRNFELTVSSLYSKGKIPGFPHLSIGQEAVAAGVCAALLPEDYVTSSHRGHGHAIAKGVDIRALMAELFGKSTGTNKGLGGTMHITAIDCGLLGCNGIAGGGIPHAVGAAFSAKIRGSAQVAVAFFGEGAASQGVFSESLNIAALWKVPVVFVCENNQYAVTTPLHIESALPDIHVRAAGYGIPSSATDGMDAIAVYEVTMDAVKKARRGEGPSLLEFKTYRFSGHFVGQIESYRTKSEVEQWAARDPIKLFKKKVLSLGLMTEMECEKIEEQAKRAIESAAEFAETAPYPEKEALTRFCYKS